MSRRSFAADRHTAIPTRVPFAPRLAAVAPTSPPSDELVPAGEIFSSLGGRECVTELNVRAACRVAGGVGHRVAALVANQHGQAAHWQLTELGLSRPSVHRACNRGSLHRSHWGVYSVGYPATSRLAILMAAVLTTGPGSCLSNESAGELLGVWTADPLEPLSVGVSRPGGHARPGIRVHRNCRLHANDLTVLEGIPTTTAPRTLMDLAPRSGPAGLDSLVGRAYRRQLLNPAALRALFDRSRGLRGVAMLRVATEELWMQPEVLRSLLEARMLRLCRAHPGANKPLVNASLDLGGRRIETDFRWPAQRLIIETDGFAFHADPRAQDADRSRDQDLQLMGWHVFRFTWRQVTREPWRVVRVLDRFFGS